MIDMETMDSELAPEAVTKVYRILLVDDHPIVRHGLGLLIDHEDDLNVCGETETVAEALDNLQTLNPDLILADISLKGASGLDLTKTLKEQNPDLPVLILSMHDEELYAERALRAGARGYIMKQESADQVIDAIRKVLEGGVYLSEQLAAKMLNNFADGNIDEIEKMGVESLSDRELEVFDLIGRGHTTRMIADRLRLSVKTIETHRAHIKQKLKIDTSTELTHRAFHWVEAGSGSS